MKKILVILLVFAFLLPMALAIPDPYDMLRGKQMIPSGAPWIADDQRMYFGDDKDSYLYYDEAGTDTLKLVGITVESAASIAMASGEDLTFTGGDSKADFSAGTGAFKTSQGTNTLSGNVAVANGKTFDMGTGDSRFNGIVLIGPAATKTLTVSGTTNVNALVSNTTISGEDLSSSDDASVNDAIRIGGNSVLMGTLRAAGATVNSLASNGSVSGTTISGEDLASSDDASVADAIRIGGNSVLIGTLKVAGATVNSLTSNTTVSAEDLASSDDMSITDAIRIGGNSILIGTIKAAGATFNSIVCNTTLSAEDLGSTDDASVADFLRVGGATDQIGAFKATGAVTTNGLTVNSTQTLAVTSADKLTVGSVIIPQEFPIASFDYSASSVDQQILVAKGKWEVTAVYMVPRVAGTDGGAVTAMLKLCDDAEAPSSGDNVLSGTLDLKGSADTLQTGTLGATVTVNSGKILALDFTGTLTSAVGHIDVYGKRVA